MDKKITKRKNEMISSCKQCGECCRVFWAAYTKKDLSDDPEYPFIKKYWRRINRKSAYQLQPLLQTIYPEKEYDWSNRCFYTCLAWDSQSKLCAQYENRPAVCRSFPFYDSKKDNPAKEWLKALQCHYVAELAPDE